VKKKLSGVNMLVMNRAEKAPFFVNSNHKLLQERAEEEERSVRKLQVALSRPLTPWPALTLAFLYLV